MARLRRICDMGKRVRKCATKSHPSLLIMHSSDGKQLELAREDGLWSPHTGKGRRGGSLFGWGVCRGGPCPPILGIFDMAPDAPGVVRGERPHHLSTGKDRPAELLV